MNGWESATPSTSASTPPSATTNSKEPNACSASAKQVSEVFASAGQAFLKLGGLIASLQNQTKSGKQRETCNGASNHNSYKKWTGPDVNNLQEAVSRFATDLQRISETIQGREVQFMADEMAKRPTTSQLVRTTSSSRTNGNPGSSGAPRYPSNPGTTARPTTVARPPTKRTGNTPQPLVDVAAKRRILTAAPSGISTPSPAHYNGGTHALPSPNNISSPVCRRRNGSVITVPPAITTVTVQSTEPAVILPPEPGTVMTTNYGGTGCLTSDYSDESTYTVLDSGRV